MNSQVYELLCSGVSQRRTARLCRINPKTVARKLLFLEKEAKLRHQQFLSSIARGDSKILKFQFDEMESFERTKLLPLSIPMAVEDETRKILGYRVCEMPAKGLIAKKSRRKYGKRADQRAQAAKSLFQELRLLISPQAHLTSDQNPQYPSWIKPLFPQLTHHAVPGKRGCIVGQGELKKIGYDPLFSFNHTAAMLRANINRLFRRTWCTTKRKDRLDAHIALYVDYHNRVLTQPREMKS